MDIKPTSGLLALIDPDGNIVHTKIGLCRDEIIEEWLEEERSMCFLGNLGRASREQTTRCTPLWEGYEAEGYSIQPVKVVAEL